MAKMLFLHSLCRAAFFLMGRREVALRGAQPQRLEWSSAVAQSQTSQTHSMSSCFRNEKRYLALIGTKLKSYL